MDYNKVIELVKDRLKKLQDDGIIVIRGKGEQEITEKFPTVEDVLIELMTEQYPVFVEDIFWVAPKPTTFRINLRNDQFFFIYKTDRSWIAQIQGKKYYLMTISDRQRAQEAISTILKYGKPEKEETEQGLQPDEIPPPPPEETPPPPPGEEALPPTLPPA